MARFALETIVAAPPSVVFGVSLDPALHVRDTVTFRSPFGPLGRLVDALFMRSYLRRLIAERNRIVAAEAESRGRTLSA